MHPKHLSKSLLVAIGATMLLGSSLAHAVPVSVLAMKLTDQLEAPGSSNNTMDAYLGWANAGGFNETAAGKQLTNNGQDYKNSFVDTNWGDVLSVRVSMYSQGTEQAFIEFDAAGTTKTNFFTQANVLSSNWSDITGAGNFFSIAGHDAIDRHWFINNNYGGCGVDVGHMVVLDSRAPGGYACSWENSRTAAGDATRAFLYSAATTEQNWTNGSIGVADMFAVHITIDDGTTPPPPSGVPVPGTLAILGLGLLGLGAGGFRRKGA